jgi:restriction endonuclease S subunit
MQYSIVNYKTVKENSDFRMDAEYFWPDFLKTEVIIRKKIHQSINTLSSDIRYGLNIEPVYTKAGINFIRAQNLKEYGIEGEILKIPLSLENIGSKNILKIGDLLIVRSGANVGDIGIVTEKFNKSTFGSYVIKFDLRNKTNPFFVYVFLKTKYGRNQTVRFRSGTAQPNISIPNLNQILIPILSENFQNNIESLFKKSGQKIQELYNFYSQAEQLLLSELRLLDWKPKHELAFVKNFSATQEAERFDAEYFQPKYEEIIEAVKKYKGGFVTLGEVAKTKRGSLIPDSFYNEQNGTPYIRGADFSSGFLSDNKLIYIDNSFSQKSETKIKKGDIVFALIGTVGSTALVDESFNDAFISNNLGKITIKNYNPTVLQILLHSIVGKLYFEKEQTQTAQPKISDKDIHKFILPKLENKIEKEIEQKYFESQKNKKLSKSLLEIAKRSVEMAIEKDEQEAEKWIEEQLRKMKE